MEKKVYVAVSGGVDSSVSLYLLKKRGFSVVGVFMIPFIDHDVLCDYQKERLDAIRVCARLGVPYKEINTNTQYRNLVIKKFVSEYEKGNIPNPDILCNKYIKFKIFLDFAIKEGADFIATGHYAQIKKINGVHKLFEAQDISKDQSYFLWAINKNILNKIIFPIGNMKKQLVRNIAKKQNLFTYLKKDSQGICFVGHIKLIDFLSKYIKFKSGDVLYKSAVVGKHAGSVFYTPGQRHGFSINNHKNKEKLYVVEKDIEKNTINVTTKKNLDKFKRKIIKIKDENILSNDFNKNELYIQYRYHGDKIKVEKKDQNLIVLKDSILVPSGQSIVFYTKNGECVGGGVVI